MLGTVSTLTLAGFIVTPRTVGARVVLSSEQLTVYHQNDLEPYSKPYPGKNGNTPMHPNNNEPSYSSCQPTLRPFDTVDTVDTGDTVNTGDTVDMVGPVKGRRAHITLGCAPGVRPVQTGVDQLDVLSQLNRGDHTSHNIEGANLTGVGQGRWIIKFDVPLRVQCLYTGGY